MENVRNHKDTKLVTTEGRRNHLASEQNHTVNLILDLRQKNGLK